MQHAHNTLQTYLTKAIGYTLLVGVAVWAAFLTVTASTVISPDFTGTYDMTLGPLLLNHFTAEAAKGGSTITIGFAPGLMGYFVLWIALGAAIGYLMHKRKRSHT